MSTGVIFLMYAGVFYFSAWLIQEEILPASKFEDIFKVLMALVFGAMTAGQSGAMAPDFGEAKLSANRIMKLLNLESKIDPENEGGQKPAKGTSLNPKIPNHWAKISDFRFLRPIMLVQGKITFNSVNFHYPTRPNVPVLKGLTLEINPGETVALVGQSGCGKSTCIQLVERSGIYELSDQE